MPPPPGSYHVLLRDVALNKAVRMLILKDLRAGEVTGVSIQNHNSLVVATQLGQGHSIGLTSSNL